MIEKVGKPPATAIQNPKEFRELEDWGPITDMIEGQSSTSGKILHKGPEGRSEAGIWTSTPGLWEVDVDRDEFCYFLEGEATYTHESGEEIAITPGTTVFFPEGWKGKCEVDSTIKKVYMVR